MYKVNYSGISDPAVRDCIRQIVLQSDIEEEVKKDKITVYLSEGYLYNGQISAIITGNSITISIITDKGNTPTPADSIKVKLNGVIRTIRSTLSLTIVFGTNWFNSGSTELAAKEIDYFIYMGYNAIDGVTLGMARIPFGLIYSDFSTTNTNEKYCAISTITNAAAGDSYRVIGRLAASLSASANYYWSVPTYTNLNLIQYPIYETRKLVWGGVLTGFSALATYVMEYTLKGRSLFLFIGWSSGSSTSNATNLTCTLPFSWVGPAYGYSALSGQGLDNGVWCLVVGEVSVKTFTASKNLLGGAWTNPGRKDINISGWFNL
jgi:hypothetical protein